MQIDSLELQNFRNYENLSLRLCRGSNILYGENAQGKTNLLEAIFMACTAKSYRFTKDRDLIRFGEEEAHIKLILRKGSAPYRIDMHLKRNQSKGIAIDEIPIRRASELFGIANIVCFSPEDLSLIKDGPVVRRRFLDLELCQLNRGYLQELGRYGRILNQRNRLLRDIPFKVGLLDTLSVWDEQLLSSGIALIEIRSAFMKRLSPIISEIHGRLSGGREKIEVDYEPNVKAENFRKKLSLLRESELKQHLSLAGPHRDDISFRIDGRDIRKFGSQGQQRTAALALKLSEIELVREMIDDTPILLLDDVLSELDSARQNYLLKILKDTQNIISCTGLDDFLSKRFPIDQLYQVEGGKIRELPRSDTKVCSGYRFSDTIKG